MKKIYNLAAKIISYFEILYETYKGIDFWHCVYTDDKGNHDYVPTGWFSKRMLKKYLDGKITENDSIIDVGCGKGRMVYFFAKMKFRKVAGLEFVEETAEIAKRNMSKLNSRGEIICGDAATYQYYGEYNYFYLFNPFNNLIMNPFLDNLKANLQNNPRKITVIYLNPWFHDLFIEHGFKLIQELHLPVYPYNCNIYTN